MMTKNNILSMIFIGFSSLAFAQQDPLYSQNQFNQSMINPAYTGVNNVLNATVIGRRQWVGLEGAPKTSIVNISSSLFNNKVGLGLIALDDRFGVNKNTELQLLYAYRIDLLNGKSFSFGLQTGYINYSYDYDQLTLEQDDQVLTLADGNITRFNVGAGAYYRTNDFYLGLSIPRMLNTNVNENGVNSTIYRRHLYISGGYVFDMSTSMKFKPSAVLKVVEGQPLSIDLNASLLLMETLWVGASIRNFNAIGLNSQFEINDQIRLGYSFEYPLNAMGGIVFSTHELMISFDIEMLRGQINGPRYF